MSADGFFCSSRAGACLALLVFVALALRAVPALDYGRDWWAPGSFTLVNFDEGGSCRARLGGFNYSVVVGHQTVALTSLLGDAPRAEDFGDRRAAKAYCHSLAHITVARLYSAVVGALTVLLLYSLARQLFPERGEIALGAAALLALSGWHISESLVGTVDAASTCAIYAFFSAAVWALRRGSWRWIAALAALACAVTVKYWVFALVALVALVPARILRALCGGVPRDRLVLLVTLLTLVFAYATGFFLHSKLVWLLPVLFYAAVPWRSIGPAARALCVVLPLGAPLALYSETFVTYTSGEFTGRFGTGYAAISWHKWLRNPINLPITALIGLGLPGFYFALRGALALYRRETFDRFWLVLLPLPAFALYMAFLAPVTYYRHYLPLLPGLCLLAALGIAQLEPRGRRRAWVLVLSWQVLLAVDLVSDYHLDPRSELRAWVAEARPAVVLSSYYVNPPPVPGLRRGLLSVARAAPSARELGVADYVLLSENWYDTAFANELNGPLVNNPDRLIKTTPAAVSFYRSALAGEHKLLSVEKRFRLPTYMPELLVHRFAYGSFTQFVGDLVVLKVHEASERD
ncbi:MAG: phospholipid carrier-dependent glycosyltransferase [Pseudomonadota bacterium]